MMRIQMKEHSTCNNQRPTSNGARAARLHLVGVRASACFPNKLKFGLQRARVLGMLDAECRRLGVFRFRLCGGILLMTLAGCLFASAQSNGVPGPTDYTRFSSFITQRNIFNPNRYSQTGRPYVRPRQRSSPSTPAFTLVGTMSYEKGMFAFFDGNNSDLRKVLYQSDTNSIAGYTVAEISLTGVKLQTAGKKQTVQMKIGEMMRLEGSEWQPVGPGALPPSTAESAAPAV